MNHRQAIALCLAVLVAVSVAGGPVSAAGIATGGSVLDGPSVTTTDGGLDGGVMSSEAENGGKNQSGTSDQDGGGDGSPDKSNSSDSSDTSGESQSESSEDETDNQEETEDETSTQEEDTGSNNNKGDKENGPPDDETADSDDSESTDETDSDSGDDSDSSGDNSSEDTVDSNDSNNEEDGNEDSDSGEETNDSGSDSEKSGDGSAEKSDSSKETDDEDNGDTQSSSTDDSENTDDSDSDETDGSNESGHDDSNDDNTVDSQDTDGDDDDSDESSDSTKGSKQSSSSSSSSNNSNAGSDSSTGSSTSDSDTSDDDTDSDGDEDDDEPDETDDDTEEDQSDDKQEEDEENKDESGKSDENNAKDENEGSEQGENAEENPERSNDNPGQSANRNSGNKNDANNKGGKSNKGSEKRNENAKQAGKDGPAISISVGPGDVHPKNNRNQKGKQNGRDDDAPPEESKDDESDEPSTVRVDVSKIQENSPVKLNVTHPGDDEQPAGFETISITPKRDGEFTIEVKISQEALPGSPAFDPADNAQSIARIRLIHSITNDEVEDVSFTFRVSKHRLQEIDTDIEAITLYRYSDGEWTALPTSPIGETDTHYLFQAESPGLSEFAIGAKRPSFNLWAATASATEIELTETVEIWGRITNEGGADGVFDAELVLNGTVVAEHELTIAADGTRQTTFYWTFKKPGKYQVILDDIKVGTINVEQSGMAGEYGRAASDDAGGGWSITQIVQSLTRWLPESKLYSPIHWGLEIAVISSVSTMLESSLRAVFEIMTGLSIDPMANSMLSVAANVMAP